MATRFQVTVDCHDPVLMVRFWCEVLGYVPEPPPAGFDSWYEFLRGIGVPEEEIADHDLCDSVVDPDGQGPRIWFQLVPEAKQIKNRLHLDLEIGGGHQVPLAERRRRIQAEARRLEAAGARRLSELAQDGLDHYAITLADPEGNEFCLH
ncbi:VOC family protein [Jatrophihabitans sp.]|uniref:VOC family protein n=1 Tax=Jatrophihabitans sp. TaxID=1932789 RepID=UPI002CAA75D1|nr:VOC family protein [Jatrophihabitans sp.]